MYTSRCTGFLVCVFLVVFCFCFFVWGGGLVVSCGGGVGGVTRVNEG